MCPVLSFGRAGDALAEQGGHETRHGHCSGGVCAFGARRRGDLELGDRALPAGGCSGLGMPDRGSLCCFRAGGHERPGPTALAGCDLGHRAPRGDGLVVIGQR